MSNYNGNSSDKSLIKYRFGNIIFQIRRFRLKLRLSINQNEKLECTKNKIFDPSRLHKHRIFITLQNQQTITIKVVHNF